ncbi:zeta toxin family protein [Bifidobacterium crudilactis]|uniref:zeta toxin family protein n=1 Tax=Bifidobacterium crudilactis TaxID=327277 RepID=UPI0005593F93|nr:zeta toxin family protein [Bifidobacterium crudilactis]
MISHASHAPRDSRSKLASAVSTICPLGQDTGNEADRLRTLEAQLHQDNLTLLESTERQAMVERLLELTPSVDPNARDPKRAAQRNAIIDDYLQRDARHDGRLVFAGGMGGAGKSTILRMMGGTDGYITVNPNDIKERMAQEGMIPNVRGLTPMEASPLVHEEASRMSKEIIHELSRTNTNMVIDKTMISVDFIPRVFDNNLDGREPVELDYSRFAGDDRYMDA